MTNGKKKISCTVDGETLKGFQIEYCKLLRENMNALPRRKTNKKNSSSTSYNTFIDYPFFIFFTKP